MRFHLPKYGPAVLAALFIVGLAAGLSAQPIVVSELPPRPADDADLVAGTWYDWFTTAGGAATISDLTGMGGDLETNQPLPPGAGLLTTELDNADRANVGVFDLLGSPGDVFPSLEIDYWFHKASNPGQNLNAAAALKMEIYDPVCGDPASGGDCFGTLIYEPYVNGFGNHPPQDVWMQASITPDSGGFWWSGGFGQPSSSAGPPYRTLNQWLGMMSSDFQDAIIVTVQIGVGSYNQGQRAYFDAVAIRHAFGDGLDVVYDFQAAVAISIDVRPGTDKNHVNTNAKQLVPIAILGSVDFDALDIDPESVLVRGASPVGTKSDESDVDGDGYADLTLYFRARNLDKPSPEECESGDAELELTGLTFSGIPFTGTDSVTWLGPDCNF